MKIVNAWITSAEIVNEGCLSFQFVLDYGGSLQGYGGWALDRKVISPPGYRPPSIAAGLSIRMLMETFKVSMWSQLKGQFCRVELDSDDMIIRIGHIIADRWFSYKDYSWNMDFYQEGAGKDA